ncbi:uncharacterized protein LOC134540912 [Bacillus rossius redtenbacheri]|uniref:uncharacterized protein LOC134540912 n=1 Tax=Bacillus rossius redtenbacheri TaxID=93214 RepID=UPI002FDDBCF2
MFRWEIPVEMSCIINIIDIIIMDGKTSGVAASSASSSSGELSPVSWSEYTLDLPDMQEEPTDEEEGAAVDEGLSLQNVIEEVRAFWEEVAAERIAMQDAWNMDITAVLHELRRLREEVEDIQDVIRREKNMIRK